MFIRLGQAFVIRAANAMMKGPDWTSSAVLVTWDDWGGFYDYVVPPQVDENGYSLRVPGRVIGPYAKVGLLDHQTLSFDAYLKLIEERFLGGRRLDPLTDGRPDSRPTVREAVRILGDLVNESTSPSRPARCSSFRPSLRRGEPPVAGRVTGMIAAELSRTLTRWSK